MADERLRIQDIGSPDLRLAAQALNANADEWLDPKTEVPQTPAGRDLFTRMVASKVTAAQATNATSAVSALAPAVTAAASTYARASALQLPGPANAQGALQLAVALAPGSDPAAITCATTLGWVGGLGGYYFAGDGPHVAMVSAFVGSLVDNAGYCPQGQFARVGAYVFNGIAYYVPLADVPAYLAAALAYFGA